MKRLDQRLAELRAISTAGPGVGGDAVEFSVLAGVSVCRSGADGRNVGLLKHASNVPQCALAIEEMFSAGLVFRPEFPIVAHRIQQVEGVIDDERIAAATLTGSEPAGQAVASQQEADKEDGARTRRQRSIHGDAQRQSGARRSRTAVKATTINNGQSCIAAKRFIVAESHLRPVRAAVR